MPSKKSFAKTVDRLFTDTEADLKMERINQITGFFLGIIILGIFNNIPSQQANATVFMIMLIVWGFMSVIETTTTKKAKKQIVVYGLGKKFFTAVAAGGAVAFLLSFVGQSIVPSFSTIPIEAQLSFLFIVVAAPFIEANFFRGLIMGTVYEYFGYFGVKNPLFKGAAALVGQAVGFAWFHTIIVVGVPGGALLPSDPIVLMPYFVFGLVAGAGVLVFKSIGFEYGLHGVNNLLAWMGG